MSIVLFVLLFASPASAFEGEIDARSIGGTGSGPVTFQIRVSKKGDVRMDTSMKRPDSKSHRASYIKRAAAKYDYPLDHEMKMLSKGKDGQTSGLEVTRLQKKKVSPEAFTIPKGYDVVEMPAMPSGMPSPQ